MVIYVKAQNNVLICLKNKLKLKRQFFKIRLNEYFKLTIIRR